MKKSRLHQIIREELHNVINESIVPDLYKSVPDNYAYDKFAIDIATFFKEEYGSHLSDRFMSVLGKSLKKSVNEGPMDRVIGGRPYKYVGDGRKGKAIVSGPMNDKQKEDIIKRAKKAGYVAKPNMGGGVTIHVKSNGLAEKKL